MQRVVVIHWYGTYKALHIHALGDGTFTFLHSELSHVKPDLLKCFDNEFMIFP